MTQKTYLLEKLAERPFLINYTDDSIYDLVNDSGTDDYFECGGIRKKLLRAESVAERENRFILNIKRQDLDRYKSVKEKYEFWIQKQDEIKRMQNEIQLINFINQFLNEWSDEEKQTVYNFPQTIAECRIQNFDEFQFNEPNQKSILRCKIMQNAASIFFISNKYYALAEETKKRDSSHILFKGHRFLLNLLGYADEIDTKYFATLLDTFDRKVGTYASIDFEVLKNIKEKYALLETELKKPLKEIKNGEDKICGIMRKDGKTFLYIQKNKYIIIDYKTGIPYGYFPACKLGVRLFINNGGYSYDFDGAERPLILDHKEYAHPAVFSYPRPNICVTGDVFRYKKVGEPFEIEEKAKLIDILKKLLFRLYDTIETGYTRDAATPYKLDEARFEKYKNCGVQQS